MRRFHEGGWVILLGLVLAVLAGCAGKADPYVKPSIAVLTFESRVGSPYRWDLGTGTRDILVDRLMKTGRYHVIERPEIDAVVNELKIQHSGYTRAQDRARLGQLKNVQYLIKGTITDFGHTGGAYAQGGNKTTRASGSVNNAMMGMTVYVIQVETGEILASERITESVSSGRVDAQTVYKGVTYGGGMFYRTPLGQATTRAIDKAVAKVTDVVARIPWIPKVAAVEEDGTLVLNGGTARGLQAGTEFDVVGPATPVVDPDNGDVIAQRPGPVLARARIRHVEQNHALAEVLSGDNGPIVTGSICRIAK